MSVLRWLVAGFGLVCSGLGFRVWVWLGLVWGVLLVCLVAIYAARPVGLGRAISVVVGFRLIWSFYFLRASRLPLAPLTGLILSFMSRNCRCM